jgi:hypothetical protein
LSRTNITPRLTNTRALIVTPSQMNAQKTREWPNRDVGAELTVVGLPEGASVAGPSAICDSRPDAVHHVLDLSVVIRERSEATEPGARSVRPQEGSFPEAQAS